LADRSRAGGRLAVAALIAVGCARRATPPLTVAAAGDLQLGAEGQVRGLGDLLHADVRFANLEGPLADRFGSSGLDEDGRPTGGPIRFAAPSSRAAWLRGRLDVVSLANNHALDQGEAGRAETQRALDAAGIASATEREPAVLTRRGRRVVLLARDLSGGASGDELEASIRRAHAGDAAVLVSLHWGHTGSLLPTPAQRALAARLVDAGATAILGHGPHSIQGIERRGQAVIAYSLGNLALGCRCTDVTDALVLHFRIGPRGDADGVRAWPIRAGLGGHAPRAESDPELARLIGILSRDLGSTTFADQNSVRIR
jgi:poly-gamma-glutamate synthesis protein (capsule biosynthesis protein)